MAECIISIKKTVTDMIQHTLLMVDVFNNDPFELIREMFGYDGVFGGLAQAFGDTVAEKQGRRAPSSTAIPDQLLRREVTPTPCNSLLQLQDDLTSTKNRIRILGLLIFNGISI